MNVKFLGKFNQSSFVFRKDHMSPYLGNECLLEDSLKNLLYYMTFSQIWFIIIVHQLDKIGK